MLQSLTDVNLAHRACRLLDADIVAEALSTVYLGKAGTVKEGKALPGSLVESSPTS